MSLLALPLPLRAVRVAALLPGLAACAVLAAVGMAAGRLPGLASHGISPLTLTILLGMAAGHALPAGWLAPGRPGIDFSRQALLRLGVVLYGLRLTVQDIAQVGAGGVVIDALVLASTFGLACVVGTRVLGLDRREAMLIGAGSAICGAAAVMATAPVVRARAGQVTIAVATVVVFGTLSTLLYPLLHAIDVHGVLVPVTPASFGVYVGSTIHEVAQVVATAHSVDATAADGAVIAKMVRVMMLAPFLLALSAGLSRARGGREGGATVRPASIQVPLFAFAFIGVVLFNSLHLLSPSMASAVDALDQGLLAMAMAALGIATNVRDVRRAGLRPVALALLLFAWLVVGGALINRGVAALVAA